MKPRFAPRPCPVCDGLQSTVLFHQSFVGLDGAGLLDGYDVAVCATCGAGFADRIPEQPAFDEYYRDLSKYESFDPALKQAPPIEPRFYHTAATIERFIPSPDARILEVGSGSGQLLKVLRDRGFRNGLASDPSPGCVAAAERLYGIPGVTGSIFTLAAPQDAFDFLILIGVMEHIRDLAGAVSRLRTLLRDGGRVYIEAPDASRYAPDADAPFQEFSVEHVNFFSRVSLANLMQRYGFEAIAVEHAVRRRNELVCANVFGVFVKSPCPPRPMERDAETEPGLRAYIEGCRAEDARIRSRITHSLQPDERMAVWGVGAHTLRLLATGGLDPARIDLFVDSNPKYQGKKLAGIAVESPTALQPYAGPVLISSRGFQREILRSARQQFGLANRFILLYDA
jgi:SAM-dependent methyltransferase